MENKNIVKLYEESFKNYHNDSALTDYFSKKSYTYYQLAEEIEKFHTLLKCCNVKKGDKVALTGKNDTKWVICYIGVITYGAVIVPILSDFNPADTINIINHSDAELLFIGEEIWKKLPQDSLERVKIAFNLQNREILYDKSEGVLTEKIENIEYPSFDIQKVNYASLDDDDVIVISYTSGTSGFSKGVMLTIRNITANVVFALEHKFHYHKSTVLALLPLAHAYGCAFDMLTPLAAGSHIYLLGKIPAPKILIEAMKETKPDLICTVPLVIEKVVKKNVFPKLEKQPLKLLSKIPLVNKLIFRKIRKTMLESFGGRMTEMNMGGAAVSPEVEKFLFKIKFPFTVGYGMTECAPLISYSRHDDYVPGSCGKILPGMEVKNGEQNEILVRGPHVMKGYYKNPKATAESIDSEGWLHTGDIGVISPDGVISLRGRSKSMILLGNGQNIYPEEIEYKLNALDLVSESLVYEENGRIIALVVPDYDEARRNKLSTDNIREIMNSNLLKLNSVVAPYEKVSSIKICVDEFIKTPKKSIIRYLYPEKANILV